MFRATGVFGLAALAIGGFMLADVLGHPKGTSAAGGTITNLWKTTATSIRG